MVARGYDGFKIQSNQVLCLTDRYRYTDTELNFPKNIFPSIHTYAIGGNILRKIRQQQVDEQFISRLGPVNRDT